MDQPGQRSGLVIAARALDHPDARCLLQAFEAEIAELYPGWTPDSGPSAKPADFAPPDGAWLVAYSNESPVGCGGLKRLDPSAVEVKRLFIAREARGHGTGRVLMEALHERAGEMGYARVRLDTGARQPAALALFLALGYSEIGDYNGNPYASYWLEKRL